MAWSCDTLDLEPTNLIPAEDAITTEKGLRAALAGVYDGLQNGDIAQELMTFGDLAADNLVAVGSRIAYREVYNNRITPNNIRMEGIWNAHYDVINRANNVLANIDGVEGITPAISDRIRGELLFIRALSHFNLVKSFGDIPIKLTPTVGISDEELNVPRRAVADVYEQIETDLNNALIALTGTGKGNPSTACEGSVLALMARVALYQGNHEAVINTTNQVMNLGYELVDGTEYALLFDKSSENDETIFKIDFSDDDVNALADYFQPAARYEVGLNQSAFSMYATEDLRIPASAQASGSDLFCNKYTDIALDSDQPIILRYADILLMRSESLNEQEYQANGEAFDLLNALRHRAGIDSVFAADAPSQASFRLILEEERRREFLGEGHRWFDLKRTGRSLDVLSGGKDITSASQLLFPIPQSELDANNNPEMVQNPDY